ERQRAVRRRERVHVERLAARRLSPLVCPAVPRRVAREDSVRLARRRGDRGRRRRRRPHGRRIVRPRTRARGEQHDDAQRRSQPRNRLHHSSTRSPSPPCSRQASGSVPARKTSLPVRGQKRLAVLPFVRSISTKVTPGGTLKPGRAATLSIAGFMNSAQIGSAPSAPLSPCGSPLS